MTAVPPGAVPTGYKAWVFGSKATGVLTFAVGIELLTRGQVPWALLMLLAGATIVLAPVRSPGRWKGSPEGRA